MKVLCVCAFLWGTFTGFLKDLYRDPEKVKNRFFKIKKFGVEQSSEKDK